MSYEASITLNCEDFSNKISDFILLLSKLNWESYNYNVFTEYLPVEDKDEFNWKTEQLSKDTLINIINHKQKNNEIIGINLFFKGKIKAGLSVLASSTQEITLGLNLYRKELSNKTTDFSWYFQNVIIPLRNNGCMISQLHFEEYFG